MEARSGRKTVELPSQSSSHSTATSSLKNFTIPRKKREAGKVFFEPCRKENREYKCIQSTLNESRLDVDKEVCQSWQCQNVRLVHNEELLREFSEKRAEMRSKGRHGREMEERLCFFVTSEQGTESVCQNGLKAESTAQHSLGNPSYGVYLYRHVDVALRSAMRNSTSPKNIIIFKVIFGKMKKLKCSYGKSSIQDPTVQFDSYISKDSAGPKDPLSQQVLGSSVFIFDYNENQELLPRPRQCLPYAVVLAVPISNPSLFATSSTPVSSTKPSSIRMTSDSAEYLKTCTASENLSNGQNSLVTMSYLRTTESATSHSGHDSQGLGATTPFQRVDYVNMHHTTCYQSYPGLQNQGDSMQQAFSCNTLNEQWGALCHSPESHCCFAPFMMGSVSVGGPIDLFASSNGGLHLDVQNKLVPSLHGNICVTQNNQQRFEQSTTGPLSYMSTTVISSRVVKDPRLAAREKRNSKEKAPEEPEQDQLTESHNSKYDLIGQSAEESWSSLLQPDKELTADEYCIKGQSKGFPEPSGNQLPDSPTQEVNEPPASSLETKNHVAQVEMTRTNGIDQYDPYLQSCKTVNPINSSTKDRRVTENSWLCVNTGSLVHNVPQNISEDRCTDVKQQIGLQISSPGTNHVLHDTIQMPVDSNLASDASKDIDTSINNCKNPANHVEMKTVVEGAKGKERTNSQESVAAEINYSSPESRAISLTNIEHASFTDGHEISSTQPDEDLNSSQYMAIPTHHCLEMLGICQKSTDLDHSNSKTDKDYFFNNLTDFSRSHNCSENADVKESWSNSERPTDFTHPESCEYSGSKQHAKVKLSDFNKTEEEALCSSGEMEREEEFSVVQKLYTEFMSIDCYEEVHDNGLSEGSITCRDYPENALTAGENEDVQKDSLCNESTHFEEGETEDLSYHSKCDEIAYACEAHSVDEELSDEIYCMLYKRIQFSQLFTSSSTSGGSLVSDKPYLKPTSLESKPKNKNSIFTLKIMNSTIQKHDASEDELSCKKRELHNLRITVANESRNTCSWEQQILSKKFSVTECLKRKCDVAMVLDDNQPSISSNISLNMSVGTDPGYIQIHRESENGTFGQDQPIFHHNTSGINEPIQEGFEIRNDHNNTTKKQCNTSVFQSIFSGENQSTVQHSESRVGKNLVYCSSSKENNKKGPEIPRKKHVKSVRLHQTMNQKGKLASCCQKPVFSDSKAVEKWNKISTQDTLRKRKNFLRTQIKTMNAARITLRSFLINRSKPSTKGENGGNTMVSGSRLNNTAINHDMSSGCLSTQINNHFANLAPIQEVDDHLKCTPLEGTFYQASDTDNKAHNEEDQIQRKDFLPEVLNSCFSGKDNSPLPTYCSNTESVDSDKQDYATNKKCQNEDVSKEYTNTCGDTAVESFKDKKDNSSGDLENQQREPEAEKDTAKALKEYRSDNATTSSKDNKPVYEKINAPLDTGSEILCDNEWGKAIGCLVEPQLETGNDLKSIFTNGEAEVVNCVIPKEKEDSHSQDPPILTHKGNSGSPSSECRLITKLKNYLTRFESTINVPETNHSNALGENTKVDRLPLLTETSQRDHATDEQQEIKSYLHVRVELPQHNLEDDGVASNSEEQNYSRFHSLTMTEDDIGKAHTQSEETNSVFLPDEASTRMCSTSDDSSCSRSAAHINLIPEEQQNLNRISKVTQDETVTLESNMEKRNDYPGLQVNMNNHSEISTQTPHTSYLMRNPSHCSEAQQSGDTYSYEKSQAEKIIILHNPWSTKPKGNTNHQSKSDPKFNTTPIQRERDYCVGDISNTLKEADFANSLNELRPLRSRCKEMLGHFISAFERDQNINFNTAVVSRDLIMKQYLKDPPAPVDLKYEALNSFLELQMMMEAVEFVDNKMRFLSGEPTFRTLLWYDPSLKEELYKGKVGCQQQSSLYSSLQENHAYNSYSRLHQYYSHIHSLTHQHQSTPITSHYMYLKNMRERLEIQVALQNCAHLESFFVSLPVSCLINFGDSLESLETLQKRVISFTELHTSQLQGPFDIGKAEHLLIMHRFISEKINYLLGCKVVDAKVSWFGLEHLQYEASKKLAWKNQNTEMSYRLLKNCDDVLQQTVMRANGAGISLLKRQPMTEAGIPIQKKMVAVKDLQGNCHKKKSRKQTKRCENVSLKKDLPSNMSRSRNPVKTPTKPIDNQGSIFQIGLQGDNNSTQYQPTNWEAFMVAENRTDHEALQVHKKMPGTWPVIPPHHCKGAWTEIPYDRQNLEWNPSASFLSHTFKATIPKSHVEVTPHLHTNKNATVSCSLLKVSAVRRGADSHLASQQQWHLSCGHKDTQEWSPVSKDPWSNMWAESEPALGLLPHSRDYPNPQNHCDPAIFSSLSTLQSPLSFPLQGNSATQSLCPLPPFLTTTKPAPLLCKPKALSYPFFLWNQNIHTTANPAFVTAAHLNGRSFHPYPKRPRASMCLSDITQHRHDL